MTDFEKQKDKAIKKMAVTGIAGNIFLAIIKLWAGILGHSMAMVSDAIHTLSDVFATTIAYVGTVLSRKEADNKHPYGHERIECVASLLLAIILFLTGMGVGFECVKTIVSGDYKNMEIPGIIAIVAAIVSIATKEAMFWYTLHYAKKYKSSVFKADAWHHRSDALSSIGALIGIIGARCGYPIFDQIAGIVICIVIMIVAINIFKDAIEKMLDTSCDKEIEESIKKTVFLYSNNNNIKIGIDLLRTRKFGEKIFVEMEISMNGDFKLKEAHDIAEEIHDEIENKNKDIKHIMIHINPA